MGMSFTAINSFCNPLGMSLAFVYLHRLKVWMTLCGLSNRWRRASVSSYNTLTTSGHCCAWNALISSVILLYIVSSHSVLLEITYNLPVQTQEKCRVMIFWMLRFYLFRFLSAKSSVCWPGSSGGRDNSSNPLYSTWCPCCLCLYWVVYPP